MQWQSDHPVRFEISGTFLEGCCWGPPPTQAVTLVLLHEGLGCVALWKDFPKALARKTGCGVFAYSRAGYGCSDPVSLPRPLDYMTREALEVLPCILDHLQIRHGVLIGHSDGASIAAIYAGNNNNKCIEGICLISPHFFTETGGLASIAQAKIAYEQDDLRARLAKYHQDPDNVFIGWNTAWLDPEFMSWNIEYCLNTIDIPVLAIQGVDDQYGTTKQIEVLKDRLKSEPELVLLDNCRHSPHIEQADKTVNIVSGFVKKMTIAVA